MAFKNIIGHSEVIENLRGRIRENRLHHAIMFYGPQGIGKRTLATEFIKAINCKNFEDEPCDNCNNCKWIEKNQHPDVLIITNGIRAETLDIKLPVKMGNQDDDAEATGKPTREILIEQVRYIEEVIYTKPVEGRYRVIFIIDAESLNKSSANAFLKTLEEPPEDTIIVMTSSFLGMVPLTIRSRTEKIRLKPLGDSDMQRLLAENLNYSSNNIKLVLRLLNGSLNRMILSADDETLRECLNMAREFIVSDIITVDRILDVAQSLTQDGDRKEREATDVHIAGGGVESKTLHVVTDQGAIIHGVVCPGVAIPREHAHAGRSADPLVVAKVHRDDVDVVAEKAPSAPHGSL
ncbi:MAG: ATP-binding protein, partial [Myxococcota bacterium]